MLKNYIKVAWRNLKKQPFFTFTLFLQSISYSVPFLFFRCTPRINPPTLLQQCLVDTVTVHVRVHHAATIVNAIETVEIVGIVIESVRAANGTRRRLRNRRLALRKPPRGTRATL